MEKKTLDLCDVLGVLLKRYHFEAFVDMYVISDVEPSVLIF